MVKIQIPKNNINLNPQNQCVSLKSFIMLAKRWYGLPFFLLMIAFLFWPGLTYLWFVWANLSIIVSIFTIHHTHAVYGEKLHYYLNGDNGLQEHERVEKIKELRQILGRAYKQLHQLSQIALTLFLIFFLLNRQYFFHWGP